MPHSTQAGSQTLRFSLAAKWFVIALTIRLLATWGMNLYLESKGAEYAISGDAQGYWILGQAIANGDDYAVHTPPRYVHRMPGFPLLLAVANAIGCNNQASARYVVAAFCALSVPAIGWLASLLGYSPKQQQWAMICATFHPWLIATSPILLTDTPFGVGLVLSVAGIVWVFQQSTPQEPSSKVLTRLGIAAFAGILAIFFRPSWILFLFAACAVAPFCFRAVQTSLKYRLGLSCCYLILLGLFLSPWILRNYMVTNHFVPLSLWMGPSLYDGLHPEATGISDMRFFDQDQFPLTMSEFEVNQHYTQLAFGWAKQNPSRVLELAFIKQQRYWGLLPTNLAVSSLRVRIALGLSSLFVIGFLITGVIRGREWKRPLLLATPVLYFALLHCLFVGSIRYRLPAELPLMIVAGIAIAGSSAGKTEPLKPNTSTDDQG